MIVGRRTHIVGGSSPLLKPSPAPRRIDADTCDIVAQALAERMSDQAREEALVMRKLAMRPRHADEIDALLLVPVLRLVEAGVVERREENGQFVFALVEEESTGYRTQPVTRNGRTFTVRTFQEYAPNNRLRIGSDYRDRVMGDDGFPIEVPEPFSDERVAA